MVNPMSPACLIRSANYFNWVYPANLLFQQHARLRTMKVQAPTEAPLLPCACRPRSMIIQKKCNQMVGIVTDASSLVELLS